MADQDFNIKVVTTADTTGLRQTSDQLEKLKTQQATFAETARRQAAAAAAAKPPPTPADNLSLAGSAVGVGTIVTLLTSAISKWKQFEEEQDRIIEGMMKATERSRELGLAVADMLDAMKSAERIDLEPLQVSFDRLTQKVGVLKREMQLAFSAGEYEDVKKLASALGVVEAQLNRVTSAIDREADASKKAAEEARKKAQAELEQRVPGLKPPPIPEADAQVQAILKNEQAAAAAKAAGNEKDAEMFQRSADQYKNSATPKQLEDLKRIHDLQQQIEPKVAPATPAPQPKPGEPGGGEKGSGGPSLTGDAAANSRGADLLKTQEASNKAMMDRLEELITINREQLGIWR